MVAGVVSAEGVSVRRMRRGRIRHGRSDANAHICFGGDIHCAKHLRGIRAAFSPETDPAMA